MCWMTRLLRALGRAARPRLRAALAPSSAFCGSDNEAYERGKLHTIETMHRTGQPLLRG